MALPTPAQPTFNDTLPDGTEFTYRPFLVAEQKSVLIAAQGGDDKSVLENLIRLVETCTFNKFNFMERRVRDFEKAFICVRSKSVGEVIEVNFRCTAKNEEGKVCGHQGNTDVHFMTDTIFTPEENHVIDIDETIKLVLKPLTMRDIVNNNKDADDIVFLYDKVEMIVQGDEFFTEFTLDDFKEFMSKISTTANDKIVSYYANFPRAKLDIQTKCRKCGSKETISIEGAVNFFG